MEKCYLCQTDKKITLCLMCIEPMCEECEAKAEPGFGFCPPCFEESQK